MDQGIVHQGIVMAPAGMFDRQVIAQQRRLLNAFQEFSQSSGNVLEIGLVHPGSKPQIPNFMALAGNQMQSGMTLHRVQASSPDGKIVKGSRRFRLPFSDHEFDWVCSSGVIEHVGDADRQFEFVREAARVAKKGAFVATPSRSHPVNFSTAGRDQLLKADDLYRMAAALPGKLEHDVGHKRFFGIKSHFFLMITKGQASE